MAWAGRRSGHDQDLPDPCRQRLSPGAHPMRDLNGRKLAPLFVALAAFGLGLATRPSDPDMYWHLASGKWMLDHGQLLRTDVFSSTVNGQPYSVGEWRRRNRPYFLSLATGGDSPL